MEETFRGYLARPHIEDYVRRWRRQGDRAFASQKKTLSCLIEETKPKTVACMGAGALSDIPYRDLVLSCDEIYLVDWMPDIVAAAIPLAIVERSAGRYRCVYCELPTQTARQFCAEICGVRAGVCEAFEESSPPGGCESFRRGRLPVIYEEDVTGGFADAFSTRLADDLRNCDSWSGAIRFASGLVQRGKELGPKTSVPDRSIDLVTSSMVVSQFQHEPWDFFVRLAQQLFGHPSAQIEREYGATLDRLHDQLIEIQVQRHLDEVVRILKPGGRCFFSFELFTRVRGKHGWRLLQHMNAVVGALGKRFEFEFDRVGLPHLLTPFPMETGGSLVQSYVLTLHRK